MEHIRRAFDTIAGEYDAQRRWIIPDIDAFYSAAVWAAEWKGDTPKILDIGAGTGLLSALLQEKYPKAHLTLLDFAEQMLNVARERFAGRTDLRYITGDYRDVDLCGGYDLICSALSIHHLPDEEKAGLYHRIYDALNPGGVFVNADQARGDTPALDRRFIEYWDAFLSDGPLTPAEQAVIRTRRDTLDQSANLGDQLTWLKTSGFSNVDVIYRNRTFVVLTGSKKSDSEEDQVWASRQ
ncbi:class I SAM-dependent methyltransferase [Methanosphaerula palustris]|uniref:Methyltransferase type 12 n=1 Tax=Methanosphaerula palustris (strain ATCC BAA-1556 / DSM 19958 / E1-9c) TaxID=521011 RepID=B8GG09_METPE|nr:class I SAM-dependent methyltransferase [Methanosphaerula palustris]ACL16083.1 Methyltransferase type 12 [Methanosphaerula palustris E1-9c]